MTSFAPYRLTPLFEDHHRWSVRSFGETVDRLQSSEDLRRLLLRKVRQIEADPDDVIAYADVFILAMDLAWRVEGNRPDFTAIELIDSLAACRLRLSTRSMIAEMSNPYIPKASDIMTWAIRAAAERGVSSDGFLANVGQKHALNCRREWGRGQVLGHDIRRRDAA